MLVSHDDTQSESCFIQRPPVKGKQSQLLYLSSVRNEEPVLVPTQLCQDNMATQQSVWHNRHGNDAVEIIREEGSNIEDDNAPGDTDFDAYNTTTDKDSDNEVSASVNQEITTFGANQYIILDMPLHKKIYIKHSICCTCTDQRLIN